MNDIAVTTPARSEVSERVIKVLREVLKPTEGALRPEASLRDDLKADSLDTIEVVLGLEEEFGIQLSDADAAHLRTVDDLVSAITSAVGREENS